MTATADMIIERKKVRRRLAFWRILSIIAIVVAVIAILPSLGGSTGSHIARVSVDGMILHEPLRERMILGLAKNDDAKAVIVSIDSPGGTLVGSEALYEALRKVAKVKPVVAVMSELAASGGYVTAIGADYIVARQNTLTGSIGVIMQAPNVEGLMQMLGVGVTEVRSAPLKAQPSFTSTPSPEVIAAQQILIDDGFAWFRDLVSERRGLTGADLDRVTDGRVHTGRLALEYGLVDVLGDESVAIDWLAETHNIDRELPVLDHDWRVPQRPWPFNTVDGLGAVISQTERLFDAAPRLYAVVK